jgi:hypothetical protein
LPELAAERVRLMEFMLTADVPLADAVGLDLPDEEA